MKNLTKNLLTIVYVLIALNILAIEVCIFIQLLDATIWESVVYTCLLTGLGLVLFCDKSPEEMYY